VQDPKPVLYPFFSWPSQTRRSKEDWFQERFLMPLLGISSYTVPEPYVLDPGPTWCEPSQLCRAGFMNSADKGHHLHTLLLSVVKTISL
jgi:hypothetical protein